MRRFLLALLAVVVLGAAAFWVITMSASVSADALGMFGLVEIVLFIATVGFAYAYVWRRGGLDWN